MTVMRMLYTAGAKNRLHNGTYRPIRKLHTMVMSTNATTYQAIWNHTLPCDLNVMLRCIGKFTHCAMNSVMANAAKYPIPPVASPVTG